jgi:hypothetical protein
MCCQSLNLTSGRRSSQSKVRRSSPFLSLTEARHSSVGMAASPGSLGASTQPRLAMHLASYAAGAGGPRIFTVHSHVFPVPSGQFPVLLKKFPVHPHRELKLTQRLSALEAASRPQTVTAYRRLPRVHRIRDHNHTSAAASCAPTVIRTLLRVFGGHGLTSRSSMGRSTLRPGSASTTLRSELWTSKWPL